MSSHSPRSSASTNYRRSEKSNRSRLDFCRLEKRNLLVSVTQALPVGVDLIANGEFEQAVDGVRGDGVRPGLFFRSAQVEGWNTGEGTNRINLINVTHRDHNNVLDLDSTESAVDRVFQDVRTRSGDRYVLSFELRERPGAGDDSATNQVEVLWNGESLGVFTGQSHWHTVAIAVEGGEGAHTRLEFREIESGSDGRGPMIDDVRLVKAAHAPVVNPGFQLSTGQGLVDAGQVDGWKSAPNAEGERRIQIDQTGEFRSLALNTDAEQLDRVFQDISTEADGLYYVSFDLRGDRSMPSENNELRVRWNNEFGGSFQATRTWQSFGFLAEASGDETTRLVFRESLADSGVSVDNIRVRQVGQFEAFGGVRALANVDPGERDQIYSQDSAAPDGKIDQSKEFRATIHLEKGSEIDLLLYDDEAPIAVDNFVNLVRDGWYDGLFFNRVVNDLSGNPFVAQAGGPFRDNTGGGPGYTFSNEIVSGLEFNRSGLLAMANSGGTNSNGSQFFITYGTPEFLNGNFTIFGEIEINDASSFDALNDLTFRDPAIASDLAIQPDVIDRITLDIS